MSRHTHNLDEVIDRAVRDAMNVDADATFDTRVAGRIGRPAPAVRWQRVALAGAVGMALVLSLLLTRTPGPDRIEPEVRAVQPELTPAPVIDPAPGLAAAMDPGEAAEASARLSSRRATAPRAAVTSSWPMSTDDDMAAAAIGIGPPLEIEALTPIEPIDVAPLQTSAIAPHEIVIAPLEPIDDVHIEALSWPEE